MEIDVGLYGKLASLEALEKPLVVLLASGMEHGPRAGLALEILARAPAVADRFVSRVRALMQERNIYRGKVTNEAVAQTFGLECATL